MTVGVRRRALAAIPVSLSDIAGDPHRNVNGQPSAYPPTGSATLSPYHVHIARGWDGRTPVRGFLVVGRCSIGVKLTVSSAAVPRVPGLDRCSRVLGERTVGRRRPRFAGVAPTRLEKAFGFDEPIWVHHTTMR